MLPLHVDAPCSVWPALRAVVQNRPRSFARVAWSVDGLSHAAISKLGCDACPLVRSASGWADPSARLMPARGRTVQVAPEAEVPSPPFVIEIMRRAIAATFGRDGPGRLQGHRASARRG